MREQNDMMDSYRNFHGMIQRYYAWQHRGKGPVNPHRGQGRILSILKLQPEITQKELTYLLDMRPQSLGELLSKLEKAGYITREASQQDRRVMVEKLTEAGAEEAEKIASEKTHSIFDVLTDEEKEQFQVITEKLIAAMEAELPEEGPRGGFGGRGGFDPRQFPGGGNFDPSKFAGFSGKHPFDKRHHHGFPSRCGGFNQPKAEDDFDF